jgi:hypothetical protein
MGGRAAEAAVVDLERGGQAEQGLDGEEDSLPARRDRCPAFELAKLLARLADCQVQVVSKLSHATRLLPALPSSGETVSILTA